MPISPSSYEGINLPALWETLAGHVRPTTFVRSDALDAVTGTRVLLVSETFQQTGSFKFRAATAVCLRDPATRLLTASSGNFGAALALAAAQAKKACTVVMPDTSAAVKIAAVRGAGATVDLIDTRQVSRADRVRQLQDVPGTRAVSPYDEVEVIAGNSSLGAELFRRAPFPCPCVVAPVGGGGLSSGIVIARDALAVAKCEVIGAEPEMANDAARSLRAGERIANAEEPATLCDGARTLSLGERNFAILRRGLGEIIEVKEETVARALRLLFQLAHLKAEPTGALALAAVLQSPARFSGRDVACIVSGANVNPALYARLIVGGPPGELQG